MIHRVKSQKLLLLCAGITVASAISSSMSFSQRLPDGGSDQHGSALELLRAEVLDTVSLDQHVHFVTPEVTEIVATPGTYRLVASEPNRLKLIPPSGQRTMIVDALVTSHTEDIATPIALFIRDDEKFPHVVLLLPGGKGLEAVGSYDASRTRGLRSFQLSPVHIQNALKKKLQKQGK
jgi:hypothetical protein